MVDTYKVGKIGNAIRIQAEEGKSEGLRNESSAESQKSIILATIIAGGIIVLLGAIGSTLLLKNKANQRELLANITQSERNIYDLNLETCASSSLTNLRLRSNFALKSIMLETESIKLKAHIDTQEQKKLAEEKTRAENVKKQQIKSFGPKPSSTQIANPGQKPTSTNPAAIQNSTDEPLPEFQIQSSENPAHLRSLLDKVTQLKSSNSSRLKELEEAAEGVCAAYTIGDELEDMSRTLAKSISKGTSLWKEITGFVELLINVLNDIGMCLTGVNAESEGKAALSTLEKVAFHLGASADNGGGVNTVLDKYKSIKLVYDQFKTMKELHDKFSPPEKTGKPKKPKTWYEKLINGLKDLISLVWGTVYKTLITDDKENKDLMQANGVAQLIVSIGKIFLLSIELYNEKKEDRDVWRYLKFAEDLSPIFRGIAAGLPALLKGSPEMTMICGYIALIFDFLQVLFKLINAIGALVKTRQMRIQSESITKEMQITKLNEKCETKNDYLIFLQELKSEGSETKLLQFKQETIDLKSNENEKFFKICQESIFTCLQHQHTNSENSKLQIFTTDEYTSLLYNYKRGPIQNIKLSMNFQYDDDFMLYGYKVMNRQYTNMNNILFCKGCKNDQVITHVCLYDRKAETSDCNFVGINNIEREGEIGRRYKIITDAIKEKIKNKKIEKILKVDGIEYQFNLIRALYNYDLVYFTKIITETSGSIRALTYFSINQNGENPTLDSRFEDFNFKVTKGLFLWTRGGDINEYETLKGTILTKVTKKFNTKFKSKIDPLEQIQISLCENTCLNKYPRFEENSCSKVFYRKHKQSNTNMTGKKLASELKVLKDFCKTCPELDNYNDQIKEIKDQDMKNLNLTSINGKFRFVFNDKIDINKIQLQLIDLDYPWTGKVLKWINIRSPGDCNGQNVECNLNSIKGIICSHLVHINNGPLVERECWNALEKNNGTGNTGTTAHIFIHNSGIVEVVNLKTYESIWTFGDDRIQDSFLEPGEYAQMTDGANNLAVYKKYSKKEPNAVPITSCKFNKKGGHPKDNFLFLCVKNESRITPFFAINKIRAKWATKGTTDPLPIHTFENNNWRKAEYEEGPLKDPTNPNGKRIYQYRGNILNGSRLINQKNGNIILKSYKNKKLWSLFRSDFINIKKVPKPLKKRGSRLVLKNQEGNYLPNIRSGSLSVHYKDPTCKEELSNKFNCNVKIVEIPGDVDPLDRSVTGLD